MKCEFKQVARGISMSIQAAADTAVVTGKLTAQAVSVIEQADEELLAACAKDNEEAELIRLFVQSDKYEDQKVAAKLAVKSLFEKWKSED